MAPPLPSDAPAREQLCLFKIDFDLSERIWFLRTRSRCLEMACAVLRRYWGSCISDDQERRGCPWGCGGRDTFTDIGVMARMSPLPQEPFSPLSSFLLHICSMLDHGH